MKAIARLSLTFLFIVLGPFAMAKPPQPMQTADSVHQQQGNGSVQKPSVEYLMNDYNRKLQQCYDDCARQYPRGGGPLQTCKRLCDGSNKKQGLYFIQ